MGKEIKKPRWQDFYYRRKKAIERGEIVNNHLKQVGDYIVVSSKVDKIAKIDWIVVHEDKFLLIQHRTLSQKNWKKTFIREEEYKALDHIDGLVLATYWFDKNENCVKITLCKLSKDIEFEIVKSRTDNYNLCFIDSKYEHDITNLPPHEIPNRFADWLVDMETMNKIMSYAE